MIHVQTLEFTEVGVVATYIKTDGVRKDGALQKVETLIIAPHPDYAEEMADLKEKAEELVRDAAEDYETSDAVDLAEDEGGDADEPGMGE